MTRKDYELIAAAIRPHVRLIHDTKLIDDLAYALLSDNPRFNVERFMKACGL